MYVEHALLKHLIAQTALTALVGERIYYVNAPQDVETPYIVFFKVSATRERSLTGTSHLVTSRFQFSIFSETYYEAKQIAEQIQLALQDKNNEIIGGTGGVRVSIQYDNEQDLYESEAGLYHIPVEYLIDYNE
jgi:hypothetical protein